LLTTTFVSSTQLTAVVPASAILFPGSYYVTASNPQPTDGPSNTVNFTVNVGTYPVPTLNSISPNSVIAGNLFAITITASGSNFASSAVLNFNGVAQPTQFFQFSEHTGLQATIPASAFATPGTAQVTVSNPSPGGGPSNSLPFTVAAGNPVPTITSLTPSSVPVNTSSTIAITGSGFLAPASVCINFPSGFICTPTTLISDTQLSVNFSTFGATSGTFPFYVVDAAPGGTSAAVNFTITPPPDFSITSSGTTSQTVNAGQNATFTNAISVSAPYGLPSHVNLSCSLPIAATHTTCAVNPNMFATGSGTAT